MSEQTKRHAKDAEYYLRTAETEIGNAERSAQGTGDKKLIERVTKIRKDVVETRKELNEKLGSG